MNAVQTLFSGLACCSNLQEQQEIKGQDDKEASFLITCFDEHDMELRDIKIHPTTTWAEMQICITDGNAARARIPWPELESHIDMIPLLLFDLHRGLFGVQEAKCRSRAVLLGHVQTRPELIPGGSALGGQAMFAYDDGTAVDLPVRNEKEFQAFLDMLKNDQSINGEYDILLLPAGQWNRYAPARTIPSSLTAYPLHMLHQFVNHTWFWPADTMKSKNMPRQRGSCLHPIVTPLQDPHVLSQNSSLGPAIRGSQMSGAPGAHQHIQNDPCIHTVHPHDDL